MIRQMRSEWQSSRSPAPSAAVSGNPSDQCREGTPRARNGYILCRQIDGRSELTHLDGDILTSLVCHVLPQNGQLCRMNPKQKPAPEPLQTHILQQREPLYSSPLLPARLCRLFERQRVLRNLITKIITTTAHTSANIHFRILLTADSLPLTVGVPSSCNP